MVDILGLAAIQVEPDMSPFKKAGAAFAAAGAAAGAVIVAGITEAMDQANITSTLQAQLGTTGKVAGEQGKIAGKLYSSGVSGTFQEAADAIKATVQAGLAPPGTTNTQLQAIATKAQDVANVFGQDLGGVTNAVSQLMRTGLAKNSAEAFDIITKGMQSGANKADDLLDTINEYSVQFGQLGLDGQTAMGLISQGLKAGARDADIVADAIKEFGIRATDGSKASSDAFKMLGLDAKSMSADIAAGGTRSRDAMDKVLDRLRKMGVDSDKARQIVAALFGGPGEDLGASLFALNMDTASKAMGNTKGAADKLGKTIRSGPSYEIQIFVRKIKQAFVETLGNQVLPIIVKFGQWINTYVAPPLTAIAITFGSVLIPTFTGLIKAISSVVGWFKQMGLWLVPITIAVVGFTAAIAASAIATGITTAVFSVYAAVIRGWTLIMRIATGVQIAFNAVMNANPVILIITAILALGAALVIAYKKSETFRNIVNGAFQGILTVGKAIGAWFSGPFVRFFTETIPGAFQAVKNWIATNWPWILGALTGPIGLAVVWIIKNWDRITKFFTTAMGALRDAISTGLNAVVDFFKKLPGRILAAVVGFGNLLVSTGKNIILGLLRGQLSIARTITTWFQTNVFRPTINFFSKAISWLVNAGKSVATGWLNGLWAVARGIGGWLRNRIYNPTINFFRNAISWLVSAGRNTMSGMLNGITRRWSDIARWLQGRGAAVRSWIGNAAGYLTGKGRDIISGLLSGLKDKWNDAIEWIKGIKDKVVGAIKRAFGISSPARVMIPLGVHIMGGLMKGILSSGGVLRSAVKGIFGSVTDVLSKGGSLVGDLIGSFGSSIGLGTSKGVDRYKTIVAMALRMLGQPIGLMPTVLRRMNQESGGNASIVNKWDSNWRAGTPSVGLMQVIGPTFRAYAGRFRSKGPFLYGVSIDPLANIYASMRYAIARYGSLSRAYNRPGGYALGTAGATSGWHWVGELGRELMKLPAGTQVKSHRDSMRMTRSAGGGITIENVVIENHGVIGSRQEVENWLVESLTTLKRKGRLP